MIVADTNLVAYLLIEGERSAAAQDVLQADSDWMAPPLWRSELRNVVTMTVRRGAIPLGTARVILATAEDIVRTWEDPLPGDQVLELAIRHSCSAYDAEFAWLARALGVPLVTSDRQLLRTFPDLATEPNMFMCR